jgi:hypothetical protein
LRLLLLKGVELNVLLLPLKVVEPRVLMLPR